MTSENKFCPLCGANNIPATTTFTADLGSGVVVVRDVRATVCSQCGVEWIDNATAKELEKIVNDARSPRVQVVVTTMP